MKIMNNEKMLVTWKGFFLKQKLACQNSSIIAINHILYYWQTILHPVIHNSHFDFMVT
jgi:hypothetical protein